MRVWLEEHTTLLVGTRQEAEFQAALLATTLSLGKATGEGAGAACVDFAKAYDGLNLDFLEQALRKAGVSEQLLGPSFAMYFGRAGNSHRRCRRAFTVAAIRVAGRVPLRDVLLGHHHPAVAVAPRLAIRAIGQDMGGRLHRLRARQRGGG